MVIPPNMVIIGIDPSPTEWNCPQIHLWRFLLWAAEWRYCHLGRKWWPRPERAEDFNICFEKEPRNPPICGISAICWWTYRLVTIFFHRPIWVGIFFLHETINFIVFWRINHLECYVRSIPWQLKMWMFRREIITTWCLTDLPVDSENQQMKIKLKKWKMK